VNTDRNCFFSKFNDSTRNCDTRNVGRYRLARGIFGDKTVCSQQLYQPGNTCTSSTPFNWVFGVLAKQILSDVTIAKTLDEVFAPEHISKQGIVIFSRLITVSIRSTHPWLSYIFIQLSFILCLILAPGQRLLNSLRTSPSKRPCSFLPRKVNTSSALKHIVACQPFMAIDIYLDLERKPHLGANMHQSKLAVNKIVIKKQALLISFLQFWPSFTISQSKTTTWFYGRKYTDQTFCDIIFLDDFFDQFFFSRTSVKIYERSFISSSHIFCMRFKLLSLLKYKWFEILDKNAITIHGPLHCLRISKRQVSFEYNTVEAFQGCGDLGFMLFDKCFHDVLLAMAV